MSPRNISKGEHSRVFSRTILQLLGVCKLAMRSTVWIAACAAVGLASKPYSDCQSACNAGEHMCTDRDLSSQCSLIQSACMKTCAQLLINDDVSSRGCSRRKLKHNFRVSFDINIVLAIYSALTLVVLSAPPVRKMILARRRPPALHLVDEPIMQPSLLMHESCFDVQHMNAGHFIDDTNLQTSLIDDENPLLQQPPTQTGGSIEVVTSQDIYTRL